MDTSHVVVLQRNHKILKENLQVDPVLDALYQDCVFTQGDYDRCRLAAPERQCELFLEILKKKGVEGYRSLCAVLDSTQPFLKERLDTTSAEAGSPDLVYVNKFTLEAQHKKVLAEKNEQLAGMQSSIKILEEQLQQKDTDHAELEEAIKIQTEEHKAETEKQNEEVEALKIKLTKSNDDLQKNRAKCEKVEKRLQEEQEAYEALSGVPRSQTPDRVDVIEQIQQAGSTERMCQFSTQSCYDENQLCLLPCLHSACKPCIVHQATHGQAKQNCTQCLSCGREFNMEQAAVDHVRHNEAAYAVKVHGEKKCNYIEGDHDAKAVMYCQDCDDLLCSDCHKLHDRPKRNQNHRVSEINQAENIPIKQWLKEPNCRDHPDTKLQLYDHTCKQAICLVCVHGAHKDHKKEDLEQAYEEAKGQLEEQLQKQQLKLKDVTDRMGTVTSHQNELVNKQRTLEQDATTVFRNVTVKFLHRQRQLMKEIKESLQAPNEMVQEKLDTLHDVHTSIVSTIDYTQRTVESTTREELITLTDVLQKKSDDNIKRKLPEDDTRDARILLSCHGQKALGELIHTFGGLASSLDLDHIPDSQPSLQELLLREQERTALHEGRWHHLDLIIHSIPGFKGFGSSIVGSQELQPEQLTSQDIFEVAKCLITRAFIPTETIPHGITLKGRASTMHIISNDSSVKYIICPKLQLDAARANTENCHVTTDGELVNTLVNTLPATYLSDRERLQKYRGTCCSTHIPLPPSPPNVTPSLNIPRYWETLSGVGVVGEVYAWFVLEMGVVEETHVDSEMYVYRQPRSWCVSVNGRCDGHQGSICTKVFAQGVQGKCHRNTMSDTTGTEATLHYGVVLDVVRGRLAFIDLDREVVLKKVDFQFREALLPVFCEGSPGRFTVNMKLISGEEIMMTGTKRSLIFEALK